MKNPKWVVGIDEVGRGPFAGPVTVCVVTMPYDYYQKNKGKWRGLTDSKKMTQKNRELWSDNVHVLKTKKEINFAIVSQSASAIDKLGITQSIRTCIKNGLQELNINPQDTLVLLDGSLKAPKEFTKQKTIIKGDSKEKIISMASVLAKVSRDSFMQKLHKKYPNYNWAQNKGYGTRAHREVILKQGITVYHRKSYLKNLLPNL